MPQSCKKPKTFCDIFYLYFNMVIQLVWVACIQLFQKHCWWLTSHFYNCESNEPVQNRFIFAVQTNENVSSINCATQRINDIYLPCSFLTTVLLHVKIGSCFWEQELNRRKDVKLKENDVDLSCLFLFKCC